MPITWVGSARADLQASPAEIQDVIGLALLQAQLGDIAPVYVAKLAGRIYVLHVFQKKSTRGIATPKHEVELIKQRLRWACWHHVQLAAGRPPEEG